MRLRNEQARQTVPAFVCLLAAALSLPLGLTGCSEPTSTTSGGSDGQKVDPAVQAQRSEEMFVSAAEEKRFVFDDRAADIAAELIALEAALFDARTVAEKVIGVQRAVPMEFKERPMKIVRTALGNQVDDAAARAPEFGAESIGLNAEFLHRIHRRRVSEIKDRNVVFGADVGNAVNRDFTGSVTPAADRRRRPAD